MSSHLREAMQQRLASRTVTPVTQISTPVALVATSTERFIHSPVFIMLISIVVCFILLMSMRPPFILRKGDPVSLGVMPAVMWSIVAGAVIIAIPAIWVGRSGD
jgi:hypothetical protein